MEMDLLDQLACVWHDVCTSPAFLRCSQSENTSDGWSESNRLVWEYINPGTGGDAPAGSGFWWGGVRLEFPSSHLPRCFWMLDVVGFHLQREAPRQVSVDAIVHLQECL